MEYDEDFNAYDTASHPNPKKRHDVWVNVGCEFGEEVQLTMGHGEMSEDGFYPDYVSFGMNTDKEIDEVIAMLNDAKQLLADYKKEIWDIEPE